MKLQVHPPEWKKFADETTGTEITQWTSHGAMHHHFYFTNPTLTPDGRSGLFLSYRTGYPNLFRINLGNGEITQFSNRVDINPFSPAPSPVDSWIYISARNTIRAISAETGEDRELCQFNAKRLGNCSLSADGKWLAVGLRHDDYGELALVETATGHSEILLRAPEVGHIQFSPKDSNLLLYSGTVLQRIWLFDRRTGSNTWLYPQKEGEWIVHESWLGNGKEVIFPHWPHALKAIHFDGSNLHTIAALNTWHVCSNRKGTRLVCDTNHPDRGLLLVDPATGRHQVLCHPHATQRGTQWPFTTPAVGAGIDTSILRSDTPENDPVPRPEDPASTYGPQWTHPHPSFSEDGGTVIYTSDCEGWSHVYSVRVPEV